jgi:predicted PurR-regulated permease PerM
VTLAGILILLGIARCASAIVVPLLLSLFIAIIAATPVNWLKDRGLPSLLSIGIVLISTIVVLVLVSLMLGSTMAQFNDALPVYQAKLSTLTESVTTLLSVPLTMAVKFAAQNNPQTRWFAVLLSPAPEEDEQLTVNRKPEKQSKENPTKQRTYMTSSRLCVQSWTVYRKNVISRQKIWEITTEGRQGSRF